MALGAGRWGVARDHGEHQEGQDERQQGEAEHVVPAERGGQAGAKRAAEHGAGVARAGDAHGLALVLRRVPLRCERQGHGEGCPGEAEEQPQQQCLRIAVHAQQPGGREGGDDDDLGEDAGALRRPAIGQQAEQEAQYGAGEDRRGDHHRALLGRSVAGRRQSAPQRAEHVPDHEAQVEIENAANRVGAWPAFQKLLFIEHLVSSGIGAERPPGGSCIATR